MKDIVQWIEYVGEDHQEIIRTETGYQQTLQTAEKTDRRDTRCLTEPMLKVCTTLSSKTKEPALGELII